MKKLFFIISTLALLTSMALVVNAHPGRTDGNGGHTDHSTGEYHYHHGYSAHDHYDMDGDGDLDCPYDFKDNTSRSPGDTVSSNSHTVSSVSESTNKDVTPKNIAIGVIILATVVIFVVSYIWLIGHNL